MQEFYLADEKHRTIKGDVVEHKGILYFKQDRSGFDGKATKEQVKAYRVEFGAFKAAHPEFVLPDSLSDLEIGAPSSVVTPEVQESAKSDRIEVFVEPVDESSATRPKRHR